MSKFCLCRRSRAEKRYGADQTGGEFQSAGQLVALVAVASDHGLRLDVPMLDFNDPNGIADFIAEARARL
jgi:hypothetical protein